MTLYLKWIIIVITIHNLNRLSPLVNGWPEPILAIFEERDSSNHKADI